MQQKFKNYASSITEKIVGTALNFKVVAKLAEKGGGMYLIDNLPAWDEELVNKKVVVTGKIVERKRVIKAFSEGITKQTDYHSSKNDTVVVELFITDAKWKLF